jgi:hypothetical protein
MRPDEIINWTKSIGVFGQPKTVFRLMKQKSTFLAIQTEDWSAEERAEFEPVALSANALIEEFYQHRKLGQRAKMLAIGKLEEYKSKHPQRSKASRLIKAGYEAEGWSDSVVSENAAAYHAYKHLKEHTDKVFRDFADEIPVYLLVLLGREQKATERSGCSYDIDDNSPRGYRCLWWDVFKYWKKNRKCPSQTQVRGYLGGYFDEKFKPRYTGSREKGRSQHDCSTNSTLDLRYSSLKPCIDTSERAINEGIERLARLLDELDVEWLSSVSAESVRRLAPYGQKLNKLIELTKTYQQA